MSFAKAKRFEERAVDVLPSPADYYITKPLDKGVKISRTGREDKVKDHGDVSCCDRSNRSNGTSLSMSHSFSSLTKSEDSHGSHFKRCCSTRRSKSSDASSKRLLKSLSQQSPQKSFKNSRTSTSFSQSEDKEGNSFVRSYSSRRSKSSEAVSRRSVKQPTPQKICEKYLRNSNNGTPTRESVEYSNFTRGSFLRSSVRKSSRRIVTEDKTEVENKNVPSFEYQEEFIDDDYDSFISKEELDQLFNVSQYEFNEVIREMKRLREQIWHGDHENKNEVTLEEKPINNKNNKKNKKLKKQHALILDETLEEADMTLVPVEYYERLERPPKQGVIMKIIKNAVEKLKNEFKEEIYKKTEKKLSELGNKFTELRLKNDRDIDEKCKYTVSRLVHKIDKVVQKHRTTLGESCKNIRRSKRFGKHYIEL